MDQDQSNGNQNSDNNQNINDVITLYKEKLLGELGFSDAQDPQKKEIEEKIENLVNNRIINLILIYLPEENAEEFKNLLDGNDYEKVISFLEDKIPGIQDKITNELMALRKELLSKV